MPATTYPTFAVHALALVADNVLFGHARHAVAQAGRYVPAKHDEHWLEPDALYMLVWQAKQEVAAAEEYVFVGHGTGITAVLVSPEKL